MWRAGHPRRSICQSFGPRRHQRAAGGDPRVGRKKKKEIRPACAGRRREETPVPEELLVVMSARWITAVRFNSRSCHRFPDGVPGTCFSGAVFLRVAEWHFSVFEVELSLAGFFARSFFRVFSGVLIHPAVIQASARDGA